MAALSAGLVVAAVSGAAIGVLGVLLLAVRPFRVHNLLFGAFLILWAGLILAGDVARWALAVDDPSLAQDAILVHLAFTVVAYLPLTRFASRYPVRGEPEGGGWLRGLAVLAPGVAGGAALVARPELFLESVTAEGIAYGPLRYVFVALLVVAFYHAVLAASQRLPDAATRVERDRLTTLALALVVYVAFFVPFAVVSGAWRLGTSGPVDSPLGAGILLAVALAGIPILAWSYRRIAANSPSPRARRWARAAFLVPGALGGATAWTLVDPDVAFVETTGLWRLVAVGLIVAAILRYDLFDVELRAKRVGIAAAGLAAIAVAGLGLELALEGAGAPRWAALTATGVALGGGGIALRQRRTSVREAVADRVLPGLGDLDRLAERRLEVYEAALAQAEAGAGVEAETGFLADLRERLGVTATEHELLVRLVRGEPTGDAGEPGEDRPGRAALEPGSLLAERYRVERELGTGSSGQALLAHDEALDRPVVVKAARAAARQDEEARRFVAEARLAARVEHRNVVRVYDRGAAGEFAYLVMAYAPGGTLADRLAEEGALAEDEALALVDDVLAGLEAIHEAGLLHRDLKPSNVVLDEEGTAKITDFGLALPLGTGQGPGDRAAPGTAVGTAAYMSPEQARGAALSPASDVYAAGALLYTLLTGEAYLPLEGMTPGEVRRTILEDPPEPLPEDVDEHVARVVEVALAKEPGDRFASAQAMRRALREPQRVAPRV